jgi:hypothetical protein
MFVVSQNNATVAYLFKATAVDSERLWNNIRF